MTSVRAQRSCQKLLGTTSYGPVIEAALRPGAFITLNHRQFRACSVGRRKWIGSTHRSHAVDKVSRGDDTDPQSESAKAGMEEEKEYHGIGDDTKSHATTRRHGLVHKRRARKEHPKAPHPIIGMNDERDRKGY